MSKESLSKRKARAALLVRLLHERYPDVSCTLDFKEEPFRLLVGAILAAQCTDARVNQVTPILFERYPQIADLAEADISELENIIRSCGLFRMKAKNIKAAAEAVDSRFAGIVPDDEAALLSLPGVGRKIANLILGDSFGKQAVVVDTHCARISALLGLTESKNPQIIERDLMKVLPQEEWTNWGHLVVTHGRELCVARRPQCVLCPLVEHCPHGMKMMAERNDG